MTEKLLPSAGQADEAASRTLRILDGVFDAEAKQRVGVRLWDGTRWPDDAPRPATLVLNHPGALRTMFLPGTELALAEAYLYDDFDIVGDIEAVFGLADALAARTSGWRKKLAAARDLLRLPAGSNPEYGQRGPARLAGKRHSVERDRAAVTYHYDVSNDFYALWLDRRMVYSCAYFQAADDDLDTAQARKLDTLCRKLRLQPGQRLLDIGCGWGGLVMYAAQHYDVDATGITLSGPQVALANERIAAAGLADRCRVEARDYRELDEPAGYDALVSVGMFEHVGAAVLPAYFAQAWRLLKPGGAFLNHGIASRATDAPLHGPSFSDTYVFPDGELTPINITLHAAEGAGFEVRDVESLREHYALTLRHWVRRLEAEHDQALKFVDEPTYRVWRLFMSGSAHGFTTGRLNVYQALLVKPDARGRSGLPLTRDDWYVAA
ncbi:MAG: cyclopropane-fatty-acyl-phospholipid synthase [Anaerolineae bacterium CG2_30_64_16]|nr:MAG: cyclopropane-fatty-acyl-phospholipid synthase [Anaerolineae bacterium CG2_30_64_16]